eukprot:scaffold37017_cov75-Phaeocystis_antarctica.AAC.1
MRLCDIGHDLRDPRSLLERIGGLGAQDRLPEDDVPRGVEQHDEPPHVLQPAAGGARGSSQRDDEHDREHGVRDRQLLHLLARDHDPLEAAHAREGEDARGQQRRRPRHATRHGAARREEPGSYYDREPRGGARHERGNEAGALACGAHLRARSLARGEDRGHVGLHAERDGLADGAEEPVDALDDLVGGERDGAERSGGERDAEAHEDAAAQRHEHGHDEDQQAAHLGARGQREERRRLAQRARLEVPHGEQREAVDVERGNGAPRRAGGAQAERAHEEEVERQVGQCGEGHGE